MSAEGTPQGGSAAQSRTATSKTEKNAAPARRWAWRRYRERAPKAALAFVLLTFGLATNARPWS